jgi:hypothetical protein
MSRSFISYLNAVDSRLESLGEDTTTQEELEDVDVAQEQGMSPAEAADLIVAARERACPVA